MPDMVKNKFSDRLNPNSSTRIPFTNISNQTLSPQTPDSSRTESPLDTPKRTLSSRALSTGTPTQQPRYAASPPVSGMQQQQSQVRTDSYATQNNPQQDRFRTQTPQLQSQYMNQQSPVTMNQTGYSSAQQGLSQKQDPRYMPQQMMTQDRYPGQQQTPSQQPYINQNQGYGAYPSNVSPQVPQQMLQPQYQMQKINSNYLGPSGAPGMGHDPPVVPNRQGSFRRRPSARDTGVGGGYSIQQAMGDHFDHYRQEPRPRNVIKHGRRIPSPARSGLSREMTPMSGLFSQQQYHPSSRMSYGPDATPDSGVSESMDGDELSPARFGRKSQMPPMIYGDSQASSLLSFAPSEEDGRTMSPTMSSIGIDSELGSEASTGSNFPRTASLYVNPPSRRKQDVPSGGKGEGVHKRKKSMPHGPKELGSPPKVIPREEVAYLSSQRREEVRRMQYEAERLRSNPLLYLVRPDLKDWFSRQQMILLVLFINITLAIMFYKLLS
ncbi:hypothetical protein X975_23030, partial [Stegodyphus mimosarum]